MSLLKCIFLSLLLAGNRYLLVASEGDTLKLPPVPTKKAYYQPLVVKTSPTALLWGGVFPFTSEFRLMIEATSSRTQSEQISISYLTSNFFLATVAALSNIKLKASGWRLQYAHKFYLIRKKKFAPYGFYVAPLVSYSNANVYLGSNRYYQKEYLEFKHFNINAIIGVQIGKFHRVTMDSYFGLGYRKNRVYAHYSNTNVVQYNTADFGELYNLPLNVVFGINLGYSL